MGVSYCVVNRQGVALASDSALTVGGRIAVFEHSQKIYQLSKKHRVAAIHSGNVNLFGVIDKILIEHFEKEYLDFKEEYSKLEDYVDAFIKYLESKKDYFKLDINEVKNIESRVYHLIYDILDDVVENFECETVEEAVIEYEKRVKSISNDSWSNPVNYINEKYKKYIKDELEEYFNMDNITKEEFDRVEKVIIENLTKFELDPLRVVFIGYEKGNIFPSIIQTNIFEYVNGKITYVTQPKLSVSGEIENQMFQICLGECNAINSFTNDIADSIFESFFEEYDAYLSKVIEEDLESISVEQKDALQERLSIIRNNVENAVMKDIDKSIIENTEALRSVSVDELVRFAENMVKMTMIQSEYNLASDYQGTVSGKVQSAYITAIKGFEWFSKPSCMRGGNK